MFNFPKDLFTDVRIEETYTTTILINDKKVSQNKVKTEKGAMIRIFDGSKWYYSSITDTDKIQEEINNLAKMAIPNPDINNHPIMKAMEINKEKVMIYQDNNVNKIPNSEKMNLILSYQDIFDKYSDIKSCKMIYSDKHLEKHIVSSLGTDVAYDQQFASLNFTCVIVCNNIPHYSIPRIYKTSFEQLSNCRDEVEAELKEDLNYAANAQSVIPGVYTCVLSPMVAGVFAHESFGHKSEADFMIGDETMKKEWKLGSRVGSENLNILDTGMYEGSGYAPFDDEGCKAKENYLIKNGILTGRLHSSTTAADLEEKVTGNARALNFEYEPIVRMTNTFIGAGNMTKEELFAGVKDGLYIADYIHGSGMSTFTIAPRKAYRIVDGKIAEPVRISVISGNVMKTLYNIDGLSQNVIYCSSALGGCGKMEQAPLPVANGGPYVRVNNINVQ